MSRMLLAMGLSRHARWSIGLTVAKRWIRLSGKRMLHMISGCWHPLRLWRSTNREPLIAPPSMCFNTSAPWSGWEYSRFSGATTAFSVPSMSKASRSRLLEAFTAARPGIGSMRCRIEAIFHAFITEERQNHRKSQTSPHSRMRHIISCKHTTASLQEPGSSVAWRVWVYERKLCMKKSRPKRVSPSSGKVPDVMQQPWTPFVLCEQDLRSPHILTVRNSRYVVIMRRGEACDDGPDLIHLSIKRLDQRPHIPYREFKRIKDVLCGEEYEGVQLFPARSP